MERINHFLILLTGENPNIFNALTPLSKKKILSQAGLILIAPAIWFVIGYCTSSMFFTSSILFSILCGLILSLLILIIERSILMSQGNWLLGSFRIILAIIMSVIGGELVNLKIFEKDIINSKYSSIVLDKKEQTAHLESIKDNMFILYQEELNGTGGTGHIGYGDVAKLKKKEYDKAEEIYNKSNNALEVMKNDIRSRDIKVESGFLTDSKALFSLAFSDWHIGIVYFFWFLLIFLLELIVLLNKFLSKSTSFELAQVAIEVIREKEVNELKVNILNNLNKSENHKQIETALNSSFTTI